VLLCCNTKYVVHVSLCFITIFTCCVVFVQLLNSSKLVRRDSSKFVGGGSTAMAVRIWDLERTEFSNKVASGRVLEKCPCSKSSL